MYTKYNHCNPVRTNQTAIPESSRIMKTHCSTVWVTTFTGVPSDDQILHQSTVSRVQKIQVPLNLGTTPAFVPVENRPASQTTANLANTVQRIESNPYNPDTRFSVYFPAPPVPYECPERLPNPVYQTSTADCLPLRRFQGSSGV